MTVETVAVATIAGMKISTVPYSIFSAWDFIPPATWFIRNASGDYVFVHTRERQKAQAWIDDAYGKGRYTVTPSKMQKGKPLGEGSKPAFGTATR